MQNKKGISGFLCEYFRTQALVGVIIRK